MKSPQHKLFIFLLPVLITACNFLGALTPTPDKIPTEESLTIPLETGLPPADNDGGQPRTTTTVDVGASAALWVAPYLPEDITDGLVVPLTLTMAETQESADLVLMIGGETPLTHLVYALAAPLSDHPG